VVVEVSQRYILKLIILGLNIQKFIKKLMEVGLSRLVLLGRLYLIQIQIIEKWSKEKEKWL
jgi:hypothetical protein